MLVGILISPLPATVKVLARETTFRVSALVGRDWHDVRLIKPKTKHNVLNRSQLFNEEK
jgi:hypothetical protein